jgi:hypothetical protein
LQNIVISLDKAKYCLGQQGQCREAPLVLMSDGEVAEYLWNGERSIARRAVRAAAAAMLAQQVSCGVLHRALVLPAFVLLQHDAPAVYAECTAGPLPSAGCQHIACLSRYSCAQPISLPLRPQDANLVLAANTPYDFERVAEQLQHSQPMLAALLAQLGQEVEGAAAARQALQHVVSRLREMDVALGGGLTRAADVLQLYAATQVGCVVCILNRTWSLHTLRVCFLGRQPAALTVVRHSPCQGILLP